MMKINEECKQANYKPLSVTSSKQFDLTDKENRNTGEQNQSIKIFNEFRTSEKTPNSHYRFKDKDKTSPVKVYYKGDLTRDNTIYKTEQKLNLSHEDFKMGGGLNIFTNPFIGQHSNFIERESSSCNQNERSHDNTCNKSINLSNRINEDSTWSKTEINEAEVSKEREYIIKVKPITREDSKPRLNNLESKHLIGLISKQAKMNMSNIIVNVNNNNVSNPFLLKSGQSQMNSIKIQTTPQSMCYSSCHSIESFSQMSQFCSHTNSGSQSPWSSLSSVYQGEYNSNFFSSTTNPFLNSNSALNNAIAWSNLSSCNTTQFTSASAKRPFNLFINNNVNSFNSNLISNPNNVNNFHSNLNPNNERHCNINKIVEAENECEESPYITDKTQIGEEEDEFKEYEKKLLVPLNKMNDEAYKILKINKHARKPQVAANKSARMADYKRFDTSDQEDFSNYNILGKKKKVHSVKKLFSSDMKLVDVKTGKIKSFCVFRDEDMGINPYWQRHLISTNQDEDIETDDDQLMTADFYVKNEMMATVDLLKAKGLDILSNKDLITFRKK